MTSWPSSIWHVCQSPWAQARSFPQFMQASLSRARLSRGFPDLRSKIYPSRKEQVWSMILPTAKMVHGGH